MHRFREVQAHQTWSNLLELNYHREKNVYTLVSHEFGVVRLDRTFCEDIVREGSLLAHARRSLGPYVPP